MYIKNLSELVIRDNACIKIVSRYSWLDGYYVYDYKKHIFENDNTHFKFTMKQIPATKYITLFFTFYKNSDGTFTQNDNNTQCCSSELYVKIKEVPKTGYCRTFNIEEDVDFYEEYALCFMLEKMKNNISCTF